MDKHEEQELRELAKAIEGVGRPEWVCVGGEWHNISELQPKRITKDTWLKGRKRG